MKLLFENWREYLKEGDDTEPTQEQVELVKDFLKSIALIAQASEDAEEVTEGRSSRRRAHKKRLKRERIEKIKEMAGLVGIKIKDFTPEQNRLYFDAKKQFEVQKEAEEFAALNTLANGDITNVSFVRDIINKGGTPLKVALAAVVGAECVDNLSLKCVAMGIATQISTTGIV